MISQYTIYFSSSDFVVVFFTLSSGIITSYVIIRPFRSVIITMIDGSTHIWYPLVEQLLFRLGILQQIPINQNNVRLINANQNSTQNDTVINIEYQTNTLTVPSRFFTYGPEIIRSSFISSVLYTLTIIPSSIIATVGLYLYRPNSLYTVVHSLVNNSFATGAMRFLGFIGVGLTNLLERFNITEIGGYNIARLNRIVQEAFAAIEPLLHSETAANAAIIVPATVGFVALNAIILALVCPREETNTARDTILKSLREYLARRISHRRLVDLIMNSVSFVFSGLTSFLGTALRIGFIGAMRFFNSFMHWVYGVPNIGSPLEETPRLPSEVVQMLRHLGRFDLRELSINRRLREANQSFYNSFSNNTFFPLQAEVAQGEPTRIGSKEYLLSVSDTINSNLPTFVSNPVIPNNPRVIESGLAVFPYQQYNSWLSNTLQVVQESYSLVVRPWDLLTSFVGRSTVSRSSLSTQTLNNNTIDLDSFVQIMNNLDWTYSVGRHVYYIDTGNDLLQRMDVIILGVFSNSTVQLGYEYLSMLYTSPALTGSCFLK